MDSIRQATAIVFNGCVTFSQVLSVIVDRYYQSPHCLAFYSEKSIYTGIYLMVENRIITLNRI